MIALGMILVIKNMSKEYYRRKKQEHANIEGTSDDNVNRDLHLDVQQEEMNQVCIHIIDYV
jgi:hypothetical protein